MNNGQQIATGMESKTPSQLINNPDSALRFETLFNNIHGSKNGKMIYETEKFHFLKQLQEKPDLQQCTKMSIYGTFLDAAINGLSFDPSMKHMYMVSRKHKIKDDQGNERWEDRLTAEISGYGELVLRQRMGQIKYADNPVLVYKCDVFKFGSRNGSAVLEHEVNYTDRTAETPLIACYIKLTRYDGSVDYKVMTYEELMKIKKFSKSPGSTAWSDHGLPGMFAAKTIKHAFKNFPKVRTGDFARLSSETIDEEAEVSTENAPAINPELNNEAPFESSQPKVEEKTIVHENEDSY